MKGWHEYAADPLFDSGSKTRADERLLPAFASCELRHW
jgi:hypothetical protein